MLLKNGLMCLPATILQAHESILHYEWQLQQIKESDEPKSQVKSIC